MNNRDQIDTLWTDLFAGEDNQTRPGEPISDRARCQLWLALRFFDTP
jgi:hypothetical protein